MSHLAPAPPPVHDKDTARDFHTGAATAITPDATTAAAAPPKFLRPNFEGIPDELKERPNWVLWVPIWTGSKWTKRPIQPSGFGASTTKPKHWSSFEDVKQAYERAVECGYIEVRQRDKPVERALVGGVGFVFDGKPDEDGLVFAGVDFDSRALEDDIASFTKRLGSYLEASVSRKGAHVIVMARPLTSGISHNGIEMYTSGRFFTMTGCANGRPIIAAPDAFAALADELRNQSGRPQPSERTFQTEYVIDLSLDDFEAAVRYLAGLNPSPFKDYSGWRDLMFACAHAEVTMPAARERIRRLFAEASAKSGGDTANNDQLYEDALKATRQKIARGEKVISAASIISLARARGWTSETAVHYFPGNEAACRDALDEIVAADPHTFTVGDKLVILRVPDQTTPEFEKWNGDLPGTTQVLPADVVERAERLAWMRPARGGGYKRSKPPRDFCSDYITQRRGRYSARPLVGISRVPFMRDDGSIRNEMGYDPQTGIFHDRAPNLKVPSSPSLEDAKAAMQRLLKPFEHYAFENPKTGPLLDLAALLTALERPFMRTAPMFAIKGAQAGTGKGQMVRAIGHFALGTTPPFMAWGHDDDEFKKRLDAMLFASPAVLVIDNCNGRLLRGDTLEMILSEGTATIRPLGKSESVTVRNRTFFMANGNNISISGDMSRRAFVISILPRSPNPERDRFPFTPEEYAINHCDALLSEAYTIMRAYRLASVPRTDLPAVGSFPEWERKVRDLVFWLSGYDLSQEFDKNKQDDPHRQNDAALLAAMHNHFGENWFKPSEVETALKRAAGRRSAHFGLEPGFFSSLSEDQRRQWAEEDALLEASEQVFGSKPVNAKVLGHWAKGNENAFVEDFVLRRQNDKHSKSNQIKVEKVR
jgi:hypothetical protein